VRQHRHAGYSRALKRMAVGVMASAQLMLDSDLASVVPLLLDGCGGKLKLLGAYRRGSGDFDR
jgi:hypothetical protein